MGPTQTHLGFAGRMVSRRSSARFSVCCEDELLFMIGQDTGIGTRATIRGRLTWLRLSTSLLLLCDAGRNCKSDALFGLWEGGLRSREQMLKWRNPLEMTRDFHAIASPALMTGLSISNPFRAASHLQLANHRWYLTTGTGRNPNHLLNQAKRWRDGRSPTRGNFNLEKSAAFLELCETAIKKNLNAIFVLDICHVTHTKHI